MTQSGYGSRELEYFILVSPAAPLWVALFWRKSDQATRERVCEAMGEMEEEDHTNTYASSSTMNTDDTGAESDHGRNVSSGLSDVGSKNEEEQQ